MQLTSRRLGQGGYSLVELLAAAALSAVALASFTAFNRFQLFALRNQATQIDVQTTARSVVDLMSREVRRAGLDPTCGKTFAGVNIADKTRLCILADNSGNGTIQDGTLEHIDYQIDTSSGRIERRQGGSGYTWDPMLSGIDASGSEFQYFDADGVRILNGSPSNDLTLAQRNQIRRVRISVSLAEDAFDPENPQSVRAQFSTDVDLRNRFFINSTTCP